MKILGYHHKSLNFIYQEISEMGIKNFWLRAFKHSKIFPINQRDEMILSQLISITYEFGTNFECITFFFKFEKNFYFDETKLYKRYFYEQPSDPVNIFQNVVNKTEQSIISWLTQNPTIEYLKNKKKQWKKVCSFFQIFEAEVDSDQSHLHLHLLLRHVLEYYLNIIPSVN
jgi:hypothetical protein